MKYYAEYVVKYLETSFTNVTVSCEVLYNDLFLNIYLESNRNSIAQSKVIVPLLKTIGNVKSEQYFLIEIDLLNALFTHSKPPLL